ncbi:MAG: hypothetical protein AAF411_28625 [Myxococcota bacterium]
MKPFIHARTPSDLKRAHEELSHPAASLSARALRRAPAWVLHAITAQLHRAVVPLAGSLTVFVLACLRADAGLYDPRAFVGLSLLIFQWSIPGIVHVDRFCEAIGLNAWVQLTVAAFCEWIFPAFRFLAWLTAVAVVACTWKLLLITAPLLLWMEWALWEFRQRPPRD